MKIVRNIILFLLWGVLTLTITLYIISIDGIFSIWSLLSLVLPPILFFYIAKWIGVSSIRYRLLLISPVSLFCLTTLFFAGEWYYKSDIEPRYMFTEKSEIEEKIGFEFPDYREFRTLTLSKREYVSYNYTITMNIEFYNNLSDYYKEIKEYIKNPRKKESNDDYGWIEDWSINSDQEYCYSKGYYDGDIDEKISIKITPRKNKAIVIYERSATSLLYQVFTKDE